MDINPLYSVAGVLVGLIVGLTGVGGGSLMTPLLVLVFGFHPATAVGTDLLYASATKTVGTTVHGWRGTVDWQVVRRLATGSVPAAIATLLVLNHLGEKSSDTGHAITAVLAADRADARGQPRDDLAAEEGRNSRQDQRHAEHDGDRVASVG